MISYSGVQFKVENAKNKLPILKAFVETWRYVHSRYDPVQEANLLVESWDLDGSTTVVIYGLGMGYHIEACKRRYPLLEKIYVIEPYEQIINIVRQVRPEILNDDCVIILPAFTELSLSNAISDFSLSRLALHPASVDICPSTKIKELLQESLMLKHNAANAEDLLMPNWLSNSEHMHVSNVLTDQMGRYAGKLGIVVAAGPSLEDNLDHLSSFEGCNVVMLAVGAVMKALLEKGIHPTAGVFADGGPIVMKHIRSLSTDIKLPPLILLSTVYKQVKSEYPGDVNWVLQSGFEPSCLMGERNGFDIFETGGSVATLCLSILYYWGCNPIVFVGQDLAYVNGKSHASGSHHDFMVGTGSNFRGVKTVSVKGDSISTTITWNSFRHWIERFIETHPGREYINTSVGASIRGTSFMSLEQVYKNYSSSVLL